jgi:hypothetical protein
MPPKVLLENGAGYIYSFFRMTWMAKDLILQMSGFERGRILTRAAHLLRENLDDIAVLEVKVT